MGFLVGFFDIKKINKKKFKSNNICFSSVKEIIKFDPDYIIISTPPNSHLTCLKMVHKLRSKILVEKPLSATKKDSYQICKIAKKKKKRIFSVSNMRYHPGFVSLKNNIKKLGKIYSATSYFSHRLSYMRTSGLNNFASDKNEGGVILDCVHDIDLIYRLFGKLSFLNSSVGSIGKEKISAEDYAIINLQAQNKIRVSIQLDFLSCWKSRGIKVIGEKGTLIWESNGKNPEIANVGLYDKHGLVKSYLKKRKIHPDQMYKDMLLDFTSDCSNIQSISEASKILNLALEARE